MRISQLLVVAGVIGFLACSQVGCVSAKTPGEEKSSVFQGTQTLMTADPVAVTTAAKSVAEELKLNIVESGATGLDGKLVARTAKNTKLTVDVKSAGENLSRVTVRAGGFGDREIQKQVLDRIRAKLPAAPANPSNVARVTVTYPNNTSASAAPAQQPHNAGPAPAPQQAPAQQQPTAQLPF